MKPIKITELSLASLLFLLCTCCICIFSFLIRISNSNLNYSTSSENEREIQQEKKLKIPSCVQGMVSYRTCSSCKKATVVYSNSDCSTYTKLENDINCANDCPKCNQDDLKSKTCTSCNRASATYTNKDCSTYTKEIDDSSCSSLCPSLVPIQQYTYNDIIPIPSEGMCCKHCTKGKACGDTCIARNKTCHVGPGCACNY